jgi:hypothetical protein
VRRPSLARLVALLLVPVGAAAACADPDVTARCEAFRDAYCERQGALCAAVTEEACVELFDATLDCGAAEGVSDDYDACMNEVAALEECPLDLPLPCRGVVYVPDDDD